jgi:3-oxoacyl-[acyl-carrier protein] reductase
MRTVRFQPEPSARKMLAAEADFSQSARSVVYPPQMLSSQPRSAGGVCDFQSGGRRAAKLFAIRLPPDGIAVYEVPARSSPMTYAAQSRFDMRLVEGFTPLNRWCRHVGRAVATMAAGELPFTTGTAIQVDGGMHIHQY